MAQDVPRKEGYIFDPESPEELARLIDWDRATTENMGGPLAEVERPEGLSDILDLACGPGGWVLDVAFALPHTKVVGVDVSQGMIEYARARAHSQGLENASFETLDISRPLNFPDASFDLINARFIQTVLQREDWEPLLKECARLLRPEGVLRITDIIAYGSTGPAYSRLNSLMLEAMFRMGKSFGPDGQYFSVPTVLPSLFRRSGYRDVDLRAYALDFSAHTRYWSGGYHNIQIISHLAQPLLTAFGLLNAEEAGKLAEQVNLEAQSDDFCAIQYYMTVYGKRPAE